MQKEGGEANKMFLRIKNLLQDTMTIIANSRRNTRPSPSSTAEMENRVTNGAWHEPSLQYALLAGSITSNSNVW
jgi:hypothetical protein